MFRTLFSRLVTLFLGVMLVAMSLQGLLLYNLYKNDAIVRTQKSMMAEARAISLLMGRFFSTQQGQEEMYLYIYASTQKSNSEIWFVNAEGDITLRAHPRDTSLREMAVQQPITEEERRTYLEPILAGKEFSMVGSFQNRFDKDTITVACPVFWGEGNVVGAVFAHCEASQLSGAYNNAWRIILLSGIFTATLIMLLVSVTAQSVTRPLGEINRAAREIARGRLNQKLRRTGPDEVGQLAESFNTMAGELQKQEQTRVNFVANVSHELKSPMTSIQGFAQGMVDGTIPQQEHGKYLNIILDETKRLTKLVRELLDLSQVEGGKFPLNITVFDMNELIRRVIIRFLDRMEEKGIEPEITFAGEYGFVRADSDRIEQVLVNLLDNAVKFTPAGGRITLTVARQQSRLQISIADSGEGIPAEDLPFIFDRFYKADKAHTDKKGTGLGLAIVRSILEQHGEGIRAQSAPGEGTTFTFTLAAAERPESRRLSDKNEQKDGKLS